MNEESRNRTFEVIIVGGGHAGLGVSYCLAKRNVPHLLLERGRIGNSWRTQRWDNFSLNTPRRFSLLPGEQLNGEDPFGFISAGEFAAKLERYAAAFGLPVKENTEVVSLESNDNGGGFRVVASESGERREYSCRQAVIANGCMNVPVIPPFASRLAPGILQLHASNYRNPSLLPPGGVLVVGSGQSGVQIAEDLLEAGRRTWIATSMVPRVPRRYRGRDILEWMEMSGMQDEETESIADPAVLKIKQPQISGVGLRGRSLSLQYLANQGAVILGTADSADGTVVRLRADAAEHIRFADRFSAQIKQMADELIRRKGIAAPPAEEDPRDAPDPEAVCASMEREIDLRKEGIGSVIWTTGFGGDYSWMKLPVLEQEEEKTGDASAEGNGRNRGTLRHSKGMAHIERLYFIGLPWMRKRKSGIIFGIADDAEFIAERILERCG